MRQLTPKELIAIIKKENGDASFSQIERALDLPYDYFKQLELKNIDDVAPEDLALLRVLATIPWVVSVAANGYKDADKALVDNVIIKPEVDLQKRIIERGW